MSLKLFNLSLKLMISKPNSLASDNINLSIPDFLISLAFTWSKILLVKISSLVFPKFSKFIKLSINLTCALAVSAITSAWEISVVGK